MRLLACAICASLVTLAACSADEAEETRATEQDSTANGVNCDVRLDMLVTDRLAGIGIDDSTAVPISMKEKIRHLNELNRTSNAFLDVLRTKKIPIKLTGGAVTNFPELAALKGQVPRGWEGSGFTWDDVPGTGYEAGIFLGDSARPNDAWSLAIHEGAHAVDRGVGLSVKSVRLAEIYRQELARPANPADRISAYRRSNIEEFFAVAVDEYFCSRATRSRLSLHYPDVYSFVRYRLDRELRDALAPQ